jgi:hypothetical protein
MKFSKKIGIFALTVIVMWLTIVASFTFADAPPSTPTAITISLSAQSVSLGGNLTVNGSIMPSVSGFPPVSSVAVALTYTKPDGTTLTRTVTSGADGSFSDTYTLDAAGSWSVQASWAGDTAYLGATSSNEAVAVTNSSGSGGSIPMTYLYIVVVIIIIAIVAAVVAYRYMKKK